MTSLSTQLGADPIIRVGDGTGNLVDFLGTGLGAVRASTAAATASSGEVLDEVAGLDALGLNVLAHQHGDASVAFALVRNHGDAVGVKFVLNAVEQVLVLFIRDGKFANVEVHAHHVDAAVQKFGSGERCEFEFHGLEALFEVPPPQAGGGLSGLFVHFAKAGGDAKLD